jgi:hypothetical protein
VQEEGRPKLGVVLLVLAALGISPISRAATRDGHVPDASWIVRRSVAVNTADWRAQPQYSHLERDTKTKIDSDGEAKASHSKTFQVTMIEGSPYYRLLELDHEPLGTVLAQQERDKLNREIQRRLSESSDQRRARISKYQSDRSEEHLLMQQMVDAFTFKLNREEQVDGVDCYLLDAIPNRGYTPPVEKARVLLGMKGHLWIDKAEYHWVKVQAEVINPVQFGFFIAQVKPGTKFELEQAPVGGVWLPKRFAETVNASLFGIYGMRSRQEENYSDYRLLSEQAEVHPPVRTVAASSLSH